MRTKRGGDGPSPLRKNPDGKLIGTSCPHPFLESAVGRIWTMPPATSRDGRSAGLRTGISGGVLAVRAGSEAIAPVLVSCCTPDGTHTVRGFGDCNTYDRY